MKHFVSLCCSMLLFSTLTAPTLAADANPRVRIETNLGSFVVELWPNVAPETVANFLDYVDAGFYDGLIFHRVIESFMVQTGGYTADLEMREPGDNVVNESRGGPSNARGTLAMARQTHPDSANAQFFINLVPNPRLDAQGSRAGYTVFGEVVEGMGVVDRIGRVETGRRGHMADVPLEPVTMTALERLESAR